MSKMRNYAVVQMVQMDEMDEMDGWMRKSKSDVFFPLFQTLLFSDFYVDFLLKK